MLSEMPNTHYILHLFSFQKVRRKLALGHHFHTASWGFQARIGEVCSGPENLSNCPRLPLRLPRPGLLSAGRPLGPSWGPFHDGDLNMDYIPPALDHCDSWISSTTLESTYISPFSLLQEGGVSWTYYGSMKQDLLFCIQNFSFKIKGTPRHQFQNLMYNPGL